MAKDSGKRFRPQNALGTTGPNKVLRGGQTLATNPKPSTSAFLDGWEDDAFDDALTQLSVQTVERSSRNVTPDAKRKGGPQIIAREMTRLPKRNFSPSFPLPASKNFLQKTSSLAQEQHRPLYETSNSIEEELALLSQDIKTQNQIDKLEEQRNFKSAEVKVLRDQKKDLEKQVFELRSQQVEQTQKIVESKRQLETAYVAEKDKLIAEKQFLEKEKQDLERSLKREKAARQKAEFERDALLTKRSKSSNGDGVELPAAKQTSGRRSLAASSQFPTVQNFYSPSDDDARAGKRRKITNPSNGQICGSDADLGMDARPYLSTADEFVQTEKSSLAKITRRANLTNLLRLKRDQFWYLAELLRPSTN